MRINPHRFGSASPPVDIGFQTVWKTDNAGSSASNQVRIATHGAKTYACHVDWGDSTSDDITTWNDAAWTHTYASSGTYTVTITGTFQPSADYADRLKLLKINNFGDVGAMSFNQLYYAATNLDIDPGATGDFSKVTDFYAAFYGCSKVGSYPAFNAALCTSYRLAFIGNTGFHGVFPLIDTSNCTNFEQAWYGCTGITGYSAMDTAKVTNWSYVFWGNTALSAVPDLDYGAGTLFGLFAANSGVTSLPSGFGLQLGAATVLTSMFAGCTINTTDYSQFLIDLESVNSSSGLSFGGGSSKYNPAGGVARAALVSRGWTIVDGGAV